MLDQHIRQVEENLWEAPLVSGNTVKFIRTDPFGLWHVEFNSGEPPEEISGKYTTLRLLKADVELWANSRGKDFGQPPPKAPPVKTKKVARKRTPEEKKEIKTDDYSVEESVEEVAINVG